MTPFLIR